jgi:integrase/recombinase XerD
MTDLSRVRVSGPLEPLQAGFAASLLAQGYTPGSACQQMHLFAHLSRWLAAEGLGPAALMPSVVERFFEARRAAGYANYLSVRAAEPLLGFLRGLAAAPPSPPAGVPEGPVEGLLWRYRSYLALERGLVPAAADGYVHAVRPFLVGRLSAEGLDLERLSAVDVVSFVVARCPEQGRGRAKLTVTALRSLLAFLHLEGVIGRPLASAVPSSASWRLSGLPKRLEARQVEALLASCEKDTAKGVRDLAILTMLSRLGLRAGEIAGLQLDDIDWRSGEIVVHGKGARSERLPLPADVGEAIAAYLREGRPANVAARTVFVGVRAPHRALRSRSVSDVVLAAGNRAGLGRIRAHRLRHTAASEMLRAGASLPEIGQVLRHRRVASTAIYAKVDREALRKIARPWPEARS